MIGQSVFLILNVTDPFDVPVDYVFGVQVGNTIRYVTNLDKT